MNYNLGALVGKADDFFAPYGYWLHNIEGIGNRTISILLENFKNEKNIYECLEQSFGNILTIKQKQALRESKNTWDITGEFKRLEQMGINFYTINSEKYPSKLKEIPDPPYGIYVKGMLPEENIPSVAIIGARSCSEYGKHMAREFGITLAAAGIQIVSGLARGIDGIGQKAALDAEGATFAVLGNGVDICYPDENISLYRDILSSRKSGILSEFKPGTQPKPSFFPMRNRIISGMADVILVIEAKEKSGTLITVDMALEQGREVYALPGRATDALSNGCNRLIKQGAGIALNPKDLLAEILLLTGNLHHKKETGEKEGVKQKINASIKSGNEVQSDENCYGLSSMEALVLESLNLKAASMEEIYQHVVERTENEVSLPEVIWQVMELCMNGIVIQQNGVYSKAYHNR